MSGQNVTGFFVDWNGMVRRTEAPGDHYKCTVDLPSGNVNVMQSDGCTVYDASYWPSLEAIEAAGITVEFA